MRSEDFHTKKKKRWKPETNKKVVKKQRYSSWCDELCELNCVKIRSCLRGREGSYCSACIFMRSERSRS